MDITIGFSPCPNDTFIFDALVNRKIDTGNLNFEPVLEDVETLNKWALDGKLMVTKISYGVLPLVLDRYILLNSGSALGSGVGPLLICAAGMEESKLSETQVAIPGEHTTAHMLFSLAFPGARNKVFLRYDEIEDFVLSRRGMGVIIHENRFTYQEKGLKKVMDLGEFWEQTTGKPIPLGGIVALRNLAPAVIMQVSSLIKRSIEFAFEVYPALSSFIIDNSRELSESVIRKHIKLYVNDYSIELGDEGKSAVLKMMEINNSVNGSTNELNGIFA